MADEVLYELRDGAIALVTLNRPEKRNAVNPALAAALEAAVKRSEADPAVRVCVLASSSDRAFCAGADLAAVAAGEGHGMMTPDGGFAGFTHAARRKPWIAAVTGSCVAGGCEMALACDMIVAAANSTFGLPEPGRGLIAAAGGVTRLPRAIPRHVALEMIATGDPIGAARAFELSLVNRVVAPEEVLATALALAGRVASNAPLAVQESLALARIAPLLDEAGERRATEEALARLRGTEDFREGPLAFVEKRPPVWKGR